MKIPSRVMGVLGPIDIVIVPESEWHRNKKYVGEWEPRSRTISLLDQTKAQMVHTYFHELQHAAMDDCGLSNLLTEKMEEALCDLAGTARSRELETP